MTACGETRQITGVTYQDRGEFVEQEPKNLKKKIPRNYCWAFFNIKTNQQNKWTLFKPNTYPKSYLHARLQVYLFINASNNWNAHDNDGII